MRRVLNYREILNKKFEVYTDKTRSFEEYFSEGSVITLNFSTIKIVVSYFSDYIVKVFLGEEFEDERNT
ncbi:hypothetical protein, partial [uncultured Clostridium sp.]|uniref:hypothetical protein n=1 Tax=uncultured Clostridium sp. TaxID=59620 RepID=UPI00261AFE35